jgi:hypothetical protein
MDEETRAQEASSAEAERSRPHHFGFVFKVFYDFVKYDPLKFRKAARDGQLTQILRHLWTRVGDGLPEEHRLPADELKCETDEAGGRARVFVILPPAERFCECLFIAVVFKPDGLFIKSKEFSVFTLEQSVPEDGVLTYAVCSMGEKGEHAYFGRGPDNLAGFKDWLSNFLQQVKQ